MSAILDSPWKKRRGDSFALSCSLWIADRVRPLLVALDVDYASFRLVLENRLRLESVANLGFNPSRGRAGAGMTLMCLVAMFSSIGAGVIALTTHDPKLWMVVGQGVWMAIVAMLTLNHFGNVLIDATDVGVLSSLPVDDRTVFASRIAHVLVDLGLLTAFAAVIPTVLGSLVFSPLAVITIYPLSTFLAMLFMLGIISLGYAILLRAFGPARFQRAMLWTQVGGAALVIIGVQIGPRLVPWEAVGRAFEARPAVAILLPPLHYEALFRVVQGQRARWELVLASAAIVMPLFFAALTFRLASRHFVAALTDSGAIVSTVSRQFRSGGLARLGPRACTTSVARAAYGFTLAMSRREKVFLRGVLPQSASFVAMGCALVVSRRGHAGALQLQYAPFALYYLTLLSALTFELSRLSEHAQARWWFEALPVEHVRELMEGGVKALLCGVIWPIVLAAATIVLIFAGPAALPDTVQAVLELAALSMLQARWFFDQIPFTNPPDKRSAAGRVFKVFAALLAGGLLAGVHALARLHWLSQTAAILAFAALALIGWNGLRTLGARGVIRRADVT